MISIWRPSVSSSSSAGRTLLSSSASWARVSSSQNTAGAAGLAGAVDGEPDPVLDRRVLGLAHAPDVARLRPRARAASSPLLVDDADRARPRRSRTSCRASRTPRPPAPSARRSASCPSSPGRRRRARGSDRRSRRRAARRSGRGSRTSCPAARPSAFHICPEERIAAGIEASMITSLGTCRLVIPRSESTIASAGPSA